jgi:hypothetical protein
VVNIGGTQIDVMLQDEVPQLCRRNRECLERVAIGRREDLPSPHFSDLMQLSSLPVVALAG